MSVVGSLARTGRGVQATDPALRGNARANETHMELRRAGQLSAARGEERVDPWKTAISLQHGSNVSRIEYVGLYLDPHDHRWTDNRRAVRGLVRNLEQLQLWLHNKHVQNKVPAPLVETLGGPAATNDTQVSTIDLVTELQQQVAKQVDRTRVTTGPERDAFLHQLRALNERLPQTFYKVRLGTTAYGMVARPDDEIVYIRKSEMKYREEIGEEGKCMEVVELAPSARELKTSASNKTWDDVVRRDRNKTCWRDSQAWAGIKPGLKTGPNRKILEWLAAEEQGAKKLLLEIKETCAALLSQKRPTCTMCRSDPEGCNGKSKKPLKMWVFGRDKKERPLAYAVPWSKTDTLRKCPEHAKCPGLRTVDGTADRGKAEWITADSTRCPHEGIRAVMPGRPRRIDTHIDETLTQDLLVFVDQLKDNDETVGYYAIKQHTQVYKSFGPEPHFALVSKATSQIVHGNDRGLQGAKLLPGDRSGGLLQHGIAGEGVHVVGGPHQIAVYRVTVPEEPAEYSRAALRNVCPSSTNWMPYAGTAAAKHGGIMRRSSAEEAERRAEAEFDPMCEICKQPFSGPGMRCRGGTHFVCMACAVKPPPPSKSPKASPGGGTAKKKKMGAAPALAVQKRADVQVRIEVLDFENVPARNIQMRAYLGKQAGAPIPGGSGVIWNLERKVMSRLKSQHGAIAIEMYNVGLPTADGSKPDPSTAVLVGSAKCELREANRPPAWLSVFVPLPPRGKGQKRTRSAKRPRAKIRVKLTLVEH